MRSSPLRFTTRQWMIIVVFFALLLAILIQIGEKKKGQAQAVEILQQLKENMIIQDEYEVIVQAELRAEPTREREILKEAEETRRAMREGEQKLRQKLAKLRH